jgi:hypothetical protein
MTLDIGSSNDMKLAPMLNPKNIGLQYIRKLDIYLAEGKGNQQQQANFAIRMILELLPENILEKFSWHPWSPFAGDNLVLLYKKQKRMKWLEGIALDRDVLDEVQKIPDFESVFQNTRKLGLYPDRREVLDMCHVLLKNSKKVEKITMHASFDESHSPIPESELSDSSTGLGLITSTIFAHMEPFSTCTPLALKELTLQKIGLRYAAKSYCQFVNFQTIKSIRIFSCPGADALFAELSKSTMLPDKLETLEFKHEYDPEQDAMGALDGFLCLVSGIKTLTVDFQNTKKLPAATGIVRHHKTLKLLNVHAISSPIDRYDEFVYDYASFADICKKCSRLEQISVAFPPVSLIRDKHDAFEDFEVSPDDTSRGYVVFQSKVNTSPSDC